MRAPAAVATVLLAATLATAATPMVLGAGGDAAEDRAASRTWNPFLGEQRAVDAVDARRVVVRFEDPSLGEWVAARGTSTLGPAGRRAWLAKARARQQQRLDAISLAGVQFSVEHRYLRVVNGVSLVVHGDGAQLLREMHGVASVTPIRTIWPTALDRDGADGAAAASGSIDEMGDAGGAGRAVRVAVLDAGVDARHPAVAGRVLRPIDATRSTEPTAAGARGAAAAAGTTVLTDPHGTAVAGAVLAGAGAARVQVQPVQVLERRPDRDGVDALTGDSDDLLAGLERAVDPDRDASTSDGFDVAVIASTAPYAGFTESPEDHAVRAATALGTLVVAAAGNDGASGDEVGTIGAVAASDAALAIGAADLRGEVEAVDVRVRGGGVDETFDGAPLLTRDTGLPSGALPVVVVEEAGDEVVDYLDDQLRSRVTGAVALVAARDGVLVARQVRAAADAGALAVVVGAEGADAAAGTIDVDGADVPAIGISRADARDLRDVLAAGEALRIELNGTTERNPAFGSVAGFSSGGPRLDGVGRPDALAPGVGMVVAGAEGAWRHASGTSIAAAWAAGQAAAVIADGYAGSPQQLRAILLGSAVALGEDRDRPSVALQGAGVLSTERAVDAEWFVDGGRLDFGSVAPGASVRRELALRGPAGRAVPEAPRILLDDGGRDGDLELALDDGGLRLDVPADAPHGHVGGWLVLPDEGVRIPWTATVRDAAALQVPMRTSLSSEVLRPAAGPGAFASSLELAIGGAAEGGSLGIAAVQRVEVRLVDPRGKDRGPIGGLDHALPGIYTFGITGVDRSGQRLGPGAWTLRVRYVPAGDPDGAWRSGPSTTFRVAGAGRSSDARPKPEPGQD
jgi:hypothetical protein